MDNWEKDTDEFVYDKEHLYDALVRSTDDYIYIGNMKTGTFRYAPGMVKDFALPGEIVPNAAAVWGELVPVSYTHLDVYKRQGLYKIGICRKVSE